MEEIDHTYRDMFIVVPIFVDFRYHGAGSESLLGEIVRGGRMWYTRAYAGSQSDAIGARGFGGGQYVIFFFFWSMPLKALCTAWATLIHQSRVPDTHEAGVRLKDLAMHSDNPASSWAALRLLWDRYSYPGADRKYRKLYE